MVNPVSLAASFHDFASCTIASIACLSRLEMRGGGVLLRANDELSEKASSFGMAGSVYQDELAGNARLREGWRAGVHDMPLLVTAAVIRGEVMASWRH